MLESEALLPDFEEDDELCKMTLGVDNNKCF